MVLPAKEEIAMHQRSALVTACLSTLIAGCADSSMDPDAEAAALMELSREWSAYVSSGDLESGMDFWADDAVMLPPELPVLEGKQAIRKYVEAAAEIPGFKISWEPISARISQSGDMAYMIERNVIEFDDPDGNRVVKHGKVVTVWRKDAAGNWLNVVDMWNTAPAPLE